MTTHHAHVLVRRLLLLAAAVLVLGIPSTAPAQIFPPGSTVQGKPIAEWTGEFWEWLASIDSSQDPRGDPTGELARINNDGPVFFIAGTAGGDATRSFTVPVDRPLLVPLVNANYTRSPEEVDANDIPIFASDG